MAISGILGVLSKLKPNMETMTFGDRVECSTVWAYGKPAQGLISGKTESGRYKVELDTGRTCCAAPENLKLIEAAPRVTPIPCGEGCPNSFLVPEHPRAFRCTWDTGESSGWASSYEA